MKIIAAGDMDGKILENLDRLGFEVFLTRPVLSVLEGLKYHPDMQIAKIDRTAVCEPTVYEIYKDFISSAGYTPVKGKNELGSNYPQDVAYNISVVSNYIFHNTRYTDLKILEASFGKTFINTAQGYSGCSICHAGKDAVITSDMSVYKAALSYGIDSLIISAGHIRLSGFNYGFMGGASFFSGGTLYTFGKIKAHPDYDRIKEFCHKHKTEIFELSDGILSDYGSVITLD